MIARLGQVQTSPWLSANMTKPSIALSKKSSSLAPTSSKKMLGDLPPSSSVTGMRFCDAVRGGERLARFEAEAVDDVEDALRNEIADDFEQNHDRSRGLFGGLENDAVPRSQRRRHLPYGHQDC